ncbi:hypothetical protein [Saccharopolyspora sp. NPDC049357]|uniref:hypothetical protein n=1 Tax=Saccharopolyspora sp. NPDC049357 TaxID=3154507 RepID=UPI0034143836
MTCGILVLTVLRQSASLATGLLASRLVATPVLARDVHFRDLRRSDAYREQDHAQRDGHGTDTGRNPLTDHLALPVGHHRNRSLADSWKTMAASSMFADQPGRQRFQKIKLPISTRKSISLGNSVFFS